MASLTHCIKKLIYLLLLVLFLAGCENVFGENETKVTPEDLQKLTELADQGDASSQMTLGAWYFYGRGVPKDYARAHQWLTLSAAEGDSFAQALLGRMYARGQGVTQDFQQAVKWYQLGAVQGNSLAQYDLGLSYFTGKGVLQDFVFAHKWLNLAAVQGVKEAINFRDSLARKMTSSQLAEAQNLAREFKSNPDNQLKEAVQEMLQRLKQGKPLIDNSLKRSKKEKPKKENP